MSLLGRDSVIRFSVLLSFFLTWATIGLDLYALQLEGPQKPISRKVESVVYDLTYKPAAAVEKLLAPLLDKHEDYELLSDPVKNKLYLRATSASQKIAAQLINNVDRSPVVSNAAERPRGDFTPAKPSQFKPNPAMQRWNSLEPNSNLQNRPAIKNSAEIVNRFVLVDAQEIDVLEKQIAGVFARNINIIREDGREIYVISLVKSGQKIEVEFDQRRSGVLIGGPENIVGQMVSLCDALSRNNNPNGHKAKIFRVQKKNQSQLRKLIIPTADPRKQGSQIKPAPLILPVEYIFQDDPQANIPQADDRPAIQPQANDRPAIQNNGAIPIRQFEGVEIETMPDLDVIILRGRDQDLDQLEEIIKQIEKISRETQPNVQVYVLRNTGSQAISEIIAQTRDDLVGGRQGRISITPLVKPNALLLIGWGDAVTAVLELIRQLDVPIDAKTQFQVFKIKHASAVTVNTNIQSFFGNRGGLAPSVTGAVDERTNSIIVYASPRDMQEVARLIGEMDVQGGMAVNRTKIIKIKNSLAADVAQTLKTAMTSATSSTRSAVMELLAFNEKGQKILRSGTLNEVQITPNVRNNTLIVSSPRENLDLIEELIRQLDTPASKSQLKIFKIYNSDASNMVQTLRSLIPGSVAASSNLKLPTAPDEISLTPLRFSIDVRSNSILATGSEGDLRIAEALIVKLDESTSSQRTTEVYQLKNSPSVDVANAINQFLQSSRQIDNAAPGSQNPFQELEREVVVVPEPIANKLLVSATSRYFNEIKNLIEKLDEQPPQVMIQVLIAEVILNDTDEFGIEVGLQDSVLFDRSLLGDLLTTSNSTSTSTAAGIVTTTNEIVRAASNIPGFNFNSAQPLGNSGSTKSLGGAGSVGSQGISNFSLGRSNDQLGFGGLVLSASSQNVSVLLRALQESRRVDILSRPQVRTLDNQPAFIQVGQRVPRIVGSNTNQNGQSNSVTLENVGLILAVTPRISPDGTVVMEIDAEKSNLGAEQDGIPVAVSTDGTIIRSPRIDTTTAQATVSAVDGETIVLGGLITKNTQTAHRSVPYLNRIPLVKNLFKYDGLQTRRTELMIILTPRVIRNAEDNAHIRQVETARMNWCAADVFDLHGEIGAVESISTDHLDAAEPQVIYPVDNPRGQTFGNGNRLEKIREEGFLGGRFRQTNESFNKANIQSLPESFNR